MTAEQRALIEVAASTPVRDLLTQPPYAFVISVADQAAIQGRAPQPIFDPVKPSVPVR